MSQEPEPKPDPRLDAQGKPLPLCPCPKCGSPNDAATACDETDPSGQIRPRPTDLTVCIGCATVLQFTEDMTLQEVDIDQINADDDTKFQVRRLQQMIRKMRSEKA